MAEHKASNVVFFHSREAKSFNLRVNNSATKRLPVDQITTKYWPHWGASMIKISVLITSTHNQRFKVVTGYIDLPSKTGLPVPQVVHKREFVPATGDCEGGISLIAKRANVEMSCVVDGHFTAVCTVAVSRVWPPLQVPTPTRLDYNISMIPDLADISFQVEGETLRAHRLVLAARSPVLRSSTARWPRAR
ncbi:hypothetical protein C2845_PM03G32150 [Panicum miliaceum]|uniref:BTB domain-containing protein n=1 Tax=Panicum miliaceum TaxID=4540 RepID=A0A3L6T5D7_PANMI|nr:hypothetical protein C2845_PM03G32150 [Panicum miliaceum]